YDWLKISNIAPDGRFVNLWNLAPTMKVGGQDVRVNNYDAESGFGTFVRGGVNYPRISGPREDATALSAPGEITVLQPFFSGGYIVNQPTELLAFPESGRIRSDALHPAHWDSYQWRAFRTTKDPVYTQVDKSGAALPAWNDANDPMYQWAD